MIEYNLLFLTRTEKTAGSEETRIFYERDGQLIYLETNLVFQKK